MCVPFPVLEGGICKISENGILTFILQYKKDLDPQTRIELYSTLAALAKEKANISEDQAGFRIPSFSKAWKEATSILLEKAGAEALSRQYPFQLSYEHGKWIITGQPHESDAQETPLKPILNPVTGSEEDLSN